MSYRRAIKRRWRLILAVTLAAVAGATVAYGQLPPGYMADAQLLVTPALEDDPLLRGLTVIRDTRDPTRTVHTAAALVDSARAADFAARRLPGRWTGERVLEATHVIPFGESNVLAVEGKADNAQLAAQVTNEFARAAVAVRRRELLRQIDAAIEGLRLQLETAGSEEESKLSGRIAALRDLRARRDPSLSFVQGASPSRASREGLPFWLVLAIAVIAGGALGIGAAMAVELLSGRIRDEDELLRLYPLPLLVRVPKVRSRPEGADGAPFRSAPAVREAFRTLAAQLDRIPARSHPHGSETARTIAITSASSGDGKTSAVANLSAALGELGRSVLAVDLGRQPELASLLGVDGGRQADGDGLARRDLGDSIHEAPGLPGVRVLPGHGDAPAGDLGETVAQARESGADFVLFDTGSLEFGDALRLAPHVDEILLVARIGHTERERFEFARDMLERTGCTPLGLIEFSDSPGASGGEESKKPARSAGDPSSNGSPEQLPASPVEPS